MDFAWRTFRQTKPGWERVQAICDFVHGHLQFDYQKARADRTALDAFRERWRLPRLCPFGDHPLPMPEYSRALRHRLSGRYWSSAVPDPMDFSAWFEVYLQGRWYTFDARHNRRRIGRVLIGLGRDAADVPITMSFGKQSLELFRVVAEEIDLASTSESPAVKAA